MNMKSLKWTQVFLLALLILLPKQILAYQKSNIPSPNAKLYYSWSYCRLFYKPPYIKC